eukprot:301701-Chlamydomonas_euryale.AAC.4
MRRWNLAEQKAIVARLCALRPELASGPATVAASPHAVAQRLRADARQRSKLVHGPFTPPKNASASSNTIQAPAVATPGRFTGARNGRDDGEMLRLRLLPPVGFGAARVPTCLSFAAFCREGGQPGAGLSARRQIDGSRSDANMRAMRTCPARAVAAAPSRQPSPSQSCKPLGGWRHRTRVRATEGTSTGTTGGGGGGDGARVAADSPNADAAASSSSSGSSSSSSDGNGNGNGEATAAAARSSGRGVREVKLPKSGFFSIADTEQEVRALRRGSGGESCSKREGDDGDSIAFPGKQPMPDRRFGHDVRQT